MTEPVVGDKLTIRIGNETPVLYEISQIKYPILYVHKPGEPYRLSGLIFNGSKWTVSGLPSNIDLAIEPIGPWLMQNVGKTDETLKLSDADIVNKSLEDLEGSFYNEKLFKRLAKERLAEFVNLKGRHEYAKYAGEDSGPSWKAFYYLMTKLKTLENAVDPKDRARITNVMNILAKYLVREPFVVIFTDPKYKKLIPHALQALIRNENYDVLKYIIMTNNVPLAQYNSQIVDVLLDTKDQDVLKLLLQNGVHLVASDLEKLAAKNNIALLDLLAQFDIYPQLTPRILQLAYSAPTDDLLVLLSEKYSIDQLYDEALYNTALRAGRTYITDLFN